MAMPSASSGLASSSLHSSTQPSLEDTLNHLTAIDAQIRSLQQDRERCLDQLDQMVEAGQAEPKLVWNDYKITRRTKKSYTYPEHITTQREALKSAEQLSVALGEATLKETSYWEIRQPKQ